MRKFVTLFGLCLTVSLGACSDDNPTPPATATCGNSTVETGEACDDGNTEDGDGCSSTCQDETASGEVCDDGVDNDEDGSTDCDDADCAGDAACETGSDEVCDDTVDNDEDGLTDCDDDDCTDDPACAAADEICDDTVDNDEDGDVDCDDSDCADDPACDTGDEEICDDDADNDGDGDIDCDDADCAEDDACTTEVEVCDDDADNDGDGDIDCDDADCATDPACAAPVEICNDRGDNDGDGDIDCDDADCATDPACDTGDEICDDEADNDDDGDIDCDDADCASHANCVPPVELCNDRVDNDEDGDTDCDDSDCADDAACQTGDEICDDEADNDDDGDIDCEDSDCASHANCVSLPEVCDDEVDNDRDGDTDCADDDCADALACAPFCGDGNIDDGEECDDGLDNSDLIPNACRLDCTNPVCGDGTVDSGEECDNGDENGSDAECTDVCTVNTDIACSGIGELSDLAELTYDGTVSGDIVTVTGTLTGAAADLEPGVGCVEGDVATGADAVYLFTAEADGTFRFSTDNASTAANTVLYTIASCADTTAGVCNDNAGTGNGSTIYVDMTVGQRVFLVVDSVGTAGAFSLDISRVTVAADGESCVGDDVYCDEGLLCMGEPAMCAVDAAPVLTEIISQTLVDGSVHHTFVGTDSNRDVESWFIDTVTLTDTTVEDGGIIPTNPPIVTWDGDTFTMELVISWEDFYGLAATDITGHVIDARGNESAIVSSTVAAYVDPATGLGEGDACDITRVANLCDDPFTCTDVDGSTICADPAAPVLDAVTATRVDAENVRFDFTGSDVNGDVEFWRMELFLEGDVSDGVFDIDFDRVSTFGFTTFGFTSTVSPLPAGLYVRAEAVLVDAAGLESAPVSVDIPQPAAGETGDPCDPEGALTLCPETDVCGVEDAGYVCEAPEAPAVVSFEAEYLDYETTEQIVLTVEGVDPNGDVESLYVEVLTADGGGGSLTIPAANLNPDPSGRLVFSFETNPIGTGGTFFTTAGIILIDSAGLESEYVTDPLGIESGVGADCTTDGSTACEDGLTCGSALTCEVAEPPALVSLSAVRQSEDVIRFVIEGTDANGDVTGQISSFFDSEGTPVVEDLNLIIDEDVTGLTEFTVTSTITGFTGAGIASVQLGLVDAAGLESTRLDVDIAAVVEPGEACVGDGVTDICSTGSTCEEGICSSDPPTITSVTALQPAANPRNLTVTIEGTDPNADATLFAVSFTDGEGTPLLDPIVFEDGFDGDVIWTDTSFVFQVELVWDDPLLFGIANGVAIAVDSLDNESEPFPFTFRPTVGLGDACDIAEVDALCAPGFACDETLLLCDVDAADPCGGVGLIDFDTDAVFVDGEGFYVPFDTTGTDNLSQAFCAGVPSAGGEIAIAYEAPSNQVVTVSTDTEATTHDTYIYARIDFCADPSSEVACNDDFGGLQSQITFEMLAGEIAYVMIDGYTASGAGEALFTFEDLALPGDDCSGDVVCAIGSFCSPATLMCELPGDLGDDCSAVPCDDGLFCHGDTDICSLPAAIGESCEFLPCEEGAVCGETLECESLVTSCDERNILADDATSFTGDFVGALDIYPDLCSGFGLDSPEVVYEWTSDVTGIVTIDTFADALETDTVLTVTDSPTCEEPSDLNIVTCNDDVDGADGFQSEVAFPATTGVTYFIFVETWDDPETATITGTITRDVAP